MSAHQRPASSSSSSASCKAKRLLLRDIRPTPNSPSQSLLRKSDLCPHRCIYCDIWKLALIVYSRQNQNRSTPTSPSSPELSPSRQYHQPQYSTTPSPHGCISSSSPSPSSYAQALQTLESAHHLQRARLSSILSICTVPGAEESEGLRVAHDRCLAAVLELVRQERGLWREIERVREAEKEREREREAEKERERERERERDRDYGYPYAYQYAYGYGATRTPGGSSSVVSCAM